MRRHTLSADTVRYLVAAGWTVMYGPNVISFHFDHRMICRFDDGQVDVADRRDPLRAPALTDPVWRPALAMLGIDAQLLMFNPVVRGWTHPLRAAC